ncbi:MAG: hypothetical protein Fur0010_04900 [Bdellovibrio sp.]
MNLKFKESDLSTYMHQLYQFAYALVPNELACEQLVLQTYQAYLIERKETTEETSLFLFQRMFYLAQSKCHNVRAPQLRPELVPFYSLESVQRAILFLKHKTNFSLDQMEKIVNLFRHEIMSHLLIGREKLLNTVGTTVERRSPEVNEFQH